MENKKALFITPTDMYDLYGNGGVKGSQKNYKLLEKTFGKENTFLCTFPRNTDTVPPENALTFRRTNSTKEQLIAALFGCKVYFPWDEKEILRFIKEKHIDLLFIDCSTLGRLARIKADYKTVVFYHNIEADYAWNKVQNEGIWYLPSYLASKYNDKCGICADKVMCLNLRDSKRLSQLYGREADFLVPVTFSDTFDDTRTVSVYEREILFLGSFFPPNQLSIEWFIDEVMPSLKNIRLNIVGRDFEKKKSEYEKHENVHVIGSVQELGESYYKHVAVVMPIKYGAGMKVKTAEAMMYGRKIFASDEALEGYEVENVDGIVRCNTAEEYVKEINTFFDEGIFLPFYPSVRECFLEKYNTQCIEKRFEQFMEELLG